MIYIFTKRIFASIAAIGLFYAVLQIQSVQIVVLNNIVKFFTRYEIQSIKIKSTKKFPFEVNVVEVTLENKKENSTTIKDLSWKISNFSKIILNISAIDINQCKSSDKFDFSNISTSEIADAIHNFAYYLDYFENVTIDKMVVNKNNLNVNLKRNNQESVVTILNDDQELQLKLTSLKDHAQINLDGVLFNNKITANAKIYKNSIDFSATLDVFTIFGEKISNFFGNKVFVTGRLVNFKGWQFNPLKISTTNGYTIDSNCYIKDSSEIKLSARLKADEKNTANFDLSISLEPFEINGSAKIKIEDVQKFSKPFWTDVKGEFNLEAEFTKFSNFEKGKVKIEGQGLIQGKDFYLPINTYIDLNEGLGRGSLNIANKNTKGHYRNCPLMADIDFESTSSDVSIEKLKLQLHDLQIALLKPAKYNWQNGMPLAQMQFCGGMIEARDLKFSDSNIISSGNLSVRNVKIGDLKILFGQENVTGLLNGQLTKLPDRPLTIKLDLTEVFWKKHQDAEVYKILSNLSAHLDGNLDNSVLHWKLNISDNNKVNLHSTGHANTSGSLCNAKLSGLVRLNLLTDWLGTGDRIFGDISVDLHCKGPIDNLTFDGTVNADSGLYEHNEVGTFYQDITIRAKARGRKLLITRFDGKDITNSNDPSHGQLRGEGWVDFSNILSPILHVPLYLNHLRISQNDSFISDASGSLLIAGTGADVNCKGEVTLENAEYFIIENSEKKIPGIIDKKINKVHLEEKNTGTVFPLDILVHAPSGSLKVIGSGANTTWFGDIYVRKSIINPFLVGTVKLNEGTLDIFGKVLKITNGIITFVDDDRNNPLLDIKAVKDLGGGLVVAIEIKGTGKDTIFEFTSVPAMAKEEVLALLLFGKKLGEVSVLQSIQLAELTKSSRGSKKAGFFEKLRSGLGFDQFEFRTSTRGGAAENDSDATPAERAAGKTSQTVRIGKEFGKIQVGIEQGAGSETSKLIVSTPLGKNLVLQGDVGGAQNSGVGIGWIKRY